MKKLLIVSSLICLLLQNSGHAQISWDFSPTQISTVGVDASDPQVVVDENGNVTSIWIENAVVQSSTLSGGSWSSIVSLSGSGASFPRLGIDSNGNVTATWLESGVVNTANLPFSGSWSAETALSSSGASTPQLSVDATGNVVAVWVRSGFIESATQLVGGSWGSVTVISSVGAEDKPQVYIGSSGTIFAVWHSVISGFDSIGSAQGSLTGSWQTAVNVALGTSTIHNDYPHVVVDSSGDGIACWYSYELGGSYTYTNVNVLSSSFTSGGSSWPQAVAIQGGARVGLFNPAIFFLRMSIDSSDEAIAGWITAYDGATFEADVNVMLSGTPWIGYANLPAQGPYVYQMDLSVTPIGEAFAAYMSFDGSDISIRVAESSIGLGYQAWSNPSTISQGNINAYPRTSSSYSASSSTLYAAAVWINYDGSNVNVQASTAQGPTVLPATDLAVVQSSNDFDVFTEYYNTLSWTPSVDPEGYAYVIYRNGGAIAVLYDIEQSQYIDHNVIQGGTVTYGIKTLNYEDLSSTLITVTLF
jgi:hypothetical protein